MTDRSRLKTLRIAVFLTGLIFLVGLSLLIRFWPSGWSWGGGHSHYLPMILGVYATLGAFLLFASRDPLAHRSLLWFVIWSNVVHAAVMAYSATIDPAERGHLVGDVPALLLVAGVLALLIPKTASVRA